MLDDLIRRQDAIDAIDDANDGLVEDDYTYGVQSGMEKAKYVIEALQSALPEIIHCKDCKWFDVDQHQCRRQVCASFYMNDYCSKAERRTDE